MSKARSTKNVNDFFILGPTLTKGNRVLEAIHSLYYLPENFKLIFAGTAPVDQDLYGEIVDLVQRDELGSRVRFTDDASASDVVITSRSVNLRNSVTGDSPEAIASAILQAARATV